MSEHLHPGLHPDADLLNAFIEGVLPEHERSECLAHLADCPRCREIVYLAQEPVAPAPVPADPVPFWKPWFAKGWFEKGWFARRPFAPIPVLVAAVLCVLLVSVGVYRLIEPNRVEPVLTAVAAPAVKPLAPLYEPPKQLPAARPAKSISTRQLALPVERRETVPDAAPSTALVRTGPVAAPVSPAAPPPTPPPPPAPVAGGGVVGGVIAGARFSALPNSGPNIATSGIAGTVTDPAGGVVGGAMVIVRPATGTSNIDTRTDNKGQYTFAGLPPGPYELQFQAPGFKQANKQIDLQPQLIARADSRLEVGATTERITVTGEAPLLKTESGEIRQTVATNGASALPVTSPGARLGLVPESPGKLPPSTTASKDKLVLKADSSGALFFSKNGGKSWKAVKPSWQGKVVRVESTLDPGAGFQLTTDSGSVWLSRDGTHWNPAPAPR